MEVGSGWIADVRWFVRQRKSCAETLTEVGSCWADGLRRLSRSAVGLRAQADRQSTRTNSGQETTMTIAVIGATGNTGRAVVKELRALGQNPICVIRNAEKAGEVLGEDAKTAVAELTDRPALEKALDGIQSVFVVTGHSPSMVEQQNNILDAALKVGTEYLVRVSGARAAAKADSESVVGRGHAVINERLKASNIKWVILGPSMFMQNMLGQAASIKTDSKIVLPFAK